MVNLIRPGKKGKKRKKIGSVLGGRRYVGSQFVAAGIIVNAAVTIGQRRFRSAGTGAAGISRFSPRMWFFGIDKSSFGQCAMNPAAGGGVNPL